MKHAGKPLTASQRQRIVVLTDLWLERAERLLGRAFEPVQVRFDLRGAAAGQYRTHPCPLIRFNAEMAAIQLDAFCERTPPHEVAHHVVAQLYRGRKVRPHGPEWRAVMQGFGLEPSRCHDYRVEAGSIRRQRRFRYRCGCREHELSATRHNRVQRGEQEYLCRDCRQALRFRSD